MSSVIHSLINVFLIDVMHKILRYFAPKQQKSVQITIFVWMVPIALLASGVENSAPNILFLLS